jgi:putative SOS response-associated peptidase YedK
VRGSMKTPRPGDHELFAFLTCNPDGVVEPIHPKAMPVILTHKEEIEIWLTADWNEAKTLQRPLPDNGLMIVAQGETPVWLTRMLSAQTDRTSPRGCGQTLLLLP